MKRPDGAKDIKVTSPRWRDNTVPINAKDVAEHNAIHISNGFKWNGVWYASSRTIQKYPTEMRATRLNTIIYVHPVPLDELIAIEE